VKICGVTTVDDAVACVDLGADALGLNFVPSSPRRVDLKAAQAIVRAVEARGAQTLIVAVVAGLSVEAMRALRESTGVGCLQLHGDEPARDVEALLPHAYKAVRVATADDAAAAAAVPGEYVLVDAKHGASLGGTGHVFDWSLVVELATRRRLVLAGGLRPENVAEAVAAVHPYCVDVASGVERAPGVKDLARVKAFVDRTRAAAG
jgi:phosphoribosylanthranilate isomerase